MPKPARSTPRAVEAAHVWEALVPRLLHPIKLLVLEALLWVGEPMSATGLAAMVGDPRYYGGMFSYHLREMAEEGVVVQTSTRSVRGAEELFFYFPSAEEGSGRSSAGAGATR